MAANRSIGTAGLYRTVAIRAWNTQFFHAEHDEILYRIHSIEDPCCLELGRFVVNSNLRSLLRLRKDNESIGGDDDRSGGRKSMQGRARRNDPPCGAGHKRVYPAIVVVPVEDFFPLSCKRKTDGVAVPGAFRQSSGHDHILSGAFEPTVECDHAIQIVHMK